MEEASLLTTHLFITTTRISMVCLSQSACLRSLSLTQSLNSLVVGEGLEIRDNHKWYVLSKRRTRLPTLKTRSLIEFLRTQAAHTKATNQIIESVYWKCFGENVGQLSVEPGCSIWLWLILSHNKLGSCRSDGHNLLTVSASKGLEHNKQIETHILIPWLTTMYNLVSLRTSSRVFRQEIVLHQKYLEGRAHCDVLLNNMCEVFNRQLVDGRDKPIITCLEFIREYLMKRIVNVQKVISKSDGPFTPNATKVFNIIVKEAGQMKKDMYMFKVNPCNGPAFWEKSTIPNIIVPPKIHPQIGRPPKKRKKSAAELAEGMVKGNKLSKAVTEETKHEYVDLVDDYKLSAIRSQINSFLESFSELIPRELIFVFNDKELELLNNGLPEINLNDLQADTEYSGYTAASNAITWF
nr:E3 ubiquitin-protein ligase UPL1 isoform X1 [Tanacetum cinerariifolium]